MYGRILKQERIARNLTQMDLAKLIGVSQAAISFYEKDTNTPNIDIIVKIADAYNITIDELIGRDTKFKTVDIDQRNNKGTINNNF